MASNTPVPVPGSYWVIPNQLLAGAYPGAPDAEAMDARLNALLDAGIRSVIDLMDEEEVLEHENGEIFTPYEDRLEQLAEERGEIAEIQRYAIVDGSVPTPQQIELILDAIDAEIDGRNSPTYIHCSDGNGRTGLLVGCYLARHGIATGEKALETISELRAPFPELAEHKSPGNMVQERLVLRWKEEQ